MEKCCHFVDDLCRHDDLGVVFPSSVSLIPPGISVVAEKRGVVSLAKGTAASQPNRWVITRAIACERLQVESRRCTVDPRLSKHFWSPNSFGYYSDK